MLLYVRYFIVRLENSHNLLANFLVQNKAKRLFLLQVVKCESALLTSKNNHLRKSICYKGNFVVILGNIQTVCLLTTLFLFVILVWLVRFYMSEVCLTQNSATQLDNDAAVFESQSYVFFVFVLKNLHRTDHLRVKSISIFFAKTHKLLELASYRDGFTFKL